MKQKGTIWVNGKGDEIPTYAITPVLKVEEKHAHKISNVALKIEKYQQELLKLTTEAHLEVYDAKVKDAEMRKNKTPTEGMTIRSFDDTIEVKITKPDILFFDNTYTELVKQKFDEYFGSLNAVNETAIFFRDLVQDLLFTSGGKLDSSKVLKLRKYRDQISKSPKLKQRNALFVEAVDLFDKAIKNRQGNTGIYVSVADAPGAKKRRIALKYTDI